MRSFKKHINEGSTILAEDPEEEISMMMNQLSFICYAADEMANIMEDTDGMDPEEWWQNKLAVAHSEIQTLYAYMQGRNQQNEAVEDAVIDEKYDTPVKKKPVSMMSKAEKDKNDERRKAYKDHQKSLRKEDTQIDEISMTKMAAYAPKAVKSRNDAKAATHSADSNRRADAEKTLVKRKAGADNYNKKMWGYGNVAPTKESVELDEVSQETLKSYHAKSALDLRNKRDKLEKGTLTTKDHKQGQNRVTGLNRAANKMDESEINDITAQYINENNITLEELENMTEEELNELIGKAIGGAFKLGAKAVVGATRLAKRAVVNKQGNIRGTAAAKADKAGDKAEKMARQREAEYKRAKRISDMKKRASDLDKKISDLNSNKTNK